MAEFSREEAREAIDRIKRQYIGLDEEDQLNLNPSGAGQRALQTIDDLRQIASAYLENTVHELYSSDVRFVYELIQNADDNHYTQAAAERVDPFLEFRTSSGTLVVDSNEDGFRMIDLESICKNGQSTKKASVGIGEKGIGFKSVFKIASKVRIQSGPFSFSFRYDKDNAITMITPFPEDHQNLSQGVRTQMTLTLNDPAALQRSLNEFRSLPGETMLFLRKLKRITIPHELNGVLLKASFSYEYGDGCNWGLLKRQVGSSVSQTRFHITKRSMEDMPHDDSRNHTRQAEIVLAFPVDSNYAPLLKSQQVFAFLPIRDVGFEFLIQSDFITPASREDIRDCDWNRRLFDGVAECFRDAVIQLCQHSSLQYDWMKYLPSTRVYDRFWNPLRSKVIELLKMTDILRTCVEERLRKPGELRILSPDLLDRDGDPLFKDLHGCDELYLSLKYDLTDSKIRDEITALGVRNISFEEIIKRVETELNNDDSMFDSDDTEDDWHTRVAKYFTRYSRQSPDDARPLLRLKLLPLQIKRRCRAVDGPIHFPSTDGIAIPAGLDNFLIDPDVLGNSARRELFSVLGVRDYDPEVVVEKIIERYQIRPTARILETSIADLRYLYWYWEKFPNPAQLNRFIWIMDKSRTLVYREYWPAFADFSLKVDDLYFESEDEYGVSELLKPIHGLCGDLSTNAPGLDVRFIHGAYLEATFPAHRHGDQPWETWLEKVALVRRAPRLFQKNSDPARVSEVLEYLIDHRPDAVVGTLHKYWNSHYHLLGRNHLLALAKTKFPCRVVEPTPLMKTYLPLPNLKTLCRELGVEDKLPFLRVPVELDDDNKVEWQFLHTTLNVRAVEDLDFYLDILQSLVQDHPTACSAQMIQNIFKVFGEIGGRCDLRDNSKKQKVTKIFEDSQAIFAPAGDLRSVTWWKPSNSLWKAPGYFRVRFSLTSFDAYTSDSILRILFTDILDIKNVEWKHCLDELMRAKQDMGLSADNIFDLYRILWMMDIQSGDLDVIRDCFKESELIYVRSRHLWYPPSSCLWTQTTRIPGKVAIASLFPQFESFFVQKLGIKTPNISMYVEELKMLIGREESPPTETIKYLLEQINLQAPRIADVRDLLSSKIFPVRAMNGQTELRSIQQDFAIIDRHDFGRVFDGKVPILDFTREEVHAYQPLLLAFGLEDRYMSRTVDMTSEVNGGTLNPGLTQSFRAKAYALYRCAVHYHSGRCGDNENSLYHLLLQSTQIYTSRGITQTLNLAQRRLKCSVQVGEGDLHIEESDNQTSIYVPEDKRKRHICYSTHLPKELLKLLQIVEVECCATFTALLMSSAYALDAILESHGIVEVPGIEPIPLEEDSDDETVHSQNERSRQTSRQPLSTQDTTPSRDSDRRNQEEDSLAESSDSEFLTPSSSRMSRFGSTSQSTSPSPRDSLPEVASAQDMTPSRDSSRRNQEENGLAGSSLGDFLTPSSARMSPFGSASQRRSPTPRVRLPQVAITAEAEASPVPGFSDTGTGVRSRQESPAALVFGTSVQAQSYGFSYPSSRPQSRISAPQATGVQQHSVLNSFTNDNSYKELLDRVIGSAAEAVFPAHGRANSADPIFSFTERDDSISSDTDPNLQSEYESSSPFITGADWSTRKKIGAAGELYVFELLSGLGLTGFGVENWRSRIRHEVRVHDKYRNITSWTGSETADIVYDDTEGKLTEILVEHGYVASTVWWRHRTPEYYLEVKTTTMNCSRPFFVGKNQYRQMCDMTILGPAADQTGGIFGHIQPKVYIVFRVFNIDKSNIGMRAYVDPRYLEQQDELAFTAEAFTVAPSSTSSDARRSGVSA